MSKVIILSPHLDDAVFSCWQFINMPGSTVMTVFAGIPPAGTTKLWDKICGQANSELMVLQRLKENKIALKQTQATIAYLDYLDKQYRDQPLKVNDLVGQIQKAATKQSTLIAPLAASKVFRHPDHILVRQAAITLKEAGYSVAFYPDIPYMHLPSKPTANYLKRLPVIKY